MSPALASLRPRTGCFRAGRGVPQGRDLLLDDQPNKRNRRDSAQYRESKPEGDVLAPLRITEAEELWAGPLNHNGRIGNFSDKLYAALNSRSAHSGQ
jgi:hypothetical protein